MPYDKESYPEKCRNTRDMEDFIKKKWLQQISHGWGLDLESGKNCVRCNFICCIWQWKVLWQWGSVTMVKLWELQHPPATECFTIALCEQGMSQTAALSTCLGIPISFWWWVRLSRPKACRYHWSKNVLWLCWFCSTNLISFMKGLVFDTWLIVIWLIIIKCESTYKSYGPVSISGPNKEQSAEVPDWWDIERVSLKNFV